MKKVAVVYWSNTGNTEAMAHEIARGISDAGAEAEVIYVTDFSANMVDTFDAFAFGCPAMGDEELEDFEFLPVYDEVEPLLGEAPVVLFGSYDWNDGEWMELWEARAHEANLNLITTVIAKDYPDAEAEEACRAAGEKLSH